MTHCTEYSITEDTPVRSSFAFIVKKFPSVKLFYTSAATDASDKYEVCIRVFIYNMNVCFKTLALH